jgi:hypothetical protein
MNTATVLADEAPSIVAEGFEALKAKGPDEALSTWTRGSALEGDTSTKIGFIGGVSQIESAYGHIESFEILASYSTASRLRRVYAVAYLPKGPVFFNFDVYRTETGWVIYMMNFNTKPVEILPRELVDKKASQSPDPTPPSVTPAAVQPPRQP